MGGLERNGGRTEKRLAKAKAQIALEHDFPKLAQTFGMSR